MVRPYHQRFTDVAPIDVLGVQIRVLMPASAMNGEMSVFEDRNEPGVGPPLHIHHDAEEVFHILDGRYRFRCGDATLEGSPGDTLVVPRGTPHTYLNIGAGTGRLLATMRPGGFEAFFEAVSAAKLQAPADMAAILEIAARHHLEFLGPNPLTR